MKSLTLIPGQLSLSQLRDVYSHPLNITLDSSAFAAIDESVACVNAILAEGRTAYGINTGFGLLAQTRISTEDLENLQRSLVLSHAAGVGEPLDDDLARLIMVLKINSLSRGFSGIRLSVIQALIGLVNAGVTPWIPAKGSVGASGDLAPLAHMSLTLLAKAKRGYAAANGCRPPKRCVRWGWSRLPWRRKRGWRYSTAPRPRPLLPCAVCSKPKICSPPRSSAGR
jgi:histidine ammonia-lyase